MNRLLVMKCATAVAVMVACGSGGATIARAQTRPAVTRDIDNRDLAPVRIPILNNLNPAELNREVDAITVPAGKRLVIDQASVWAFTANKADVISGVWLQVKDKLFFNMISPSPSEVATFCGGTCSIAAYTRSLSMVFEAGETVHASIFTEGSHDVKIVNIYVQGHYVTP